MANGKFPDTLVLPITTFFGSSGECPADLKAQISQGNTFSVAFDMTEAPHAPGGDGLVFLKTDPQSNFVAAKRVQLSNEGLSNAIGFMGTATTEATIFGTKQLVTRIFLVGTPKGDVFTWATGMIVNDNCSLINRAEDEALMTTLKLKR
jgi:hypothetical protein